MDLPPSGWYPDPYRVPGLLRWWDGSTWTHHTHPGGGTGAAEGAEPAATVQQAVVGPTAVQPAVESAGVPSTAVQPAMQATTVQPATVPPTTVPPSAVQPTLVQPGLAGLAGGPAVYSRPTWRTARR